MKQLIPNNLRKFISRYLTNLRGWRTNRKIVVIESDDWGSIRMPSREVYEKCLRAGYRVDLNPYERYDSLASEDDLELLFDLLTSFKDNKGNHPVITANTLVANPHFGKIKESGFSNYHYEMITDTFNSYPKHSNCFNLWHKGLDAGIIYFQSHGREHLNVSEYINALQKGDPDAHFSFQQKMPGIIPKNSEENASNKYVEALRYNSSEDKSDKLNIVIDGLQHFRKLFGYNSESFIPPNYRWSPDFNEVIAGEGVRFLQGQRKLKESLENDKVKLHSHYLGKKTQFDQIYLQRNAVFEPSLFNLKIDDPLNYCLADISASFTMKKPAVITCHRINFVGTIDESNRDRTLLLMKQLLIAIMSRWPDVEFLTSTELGHLIIQTK